MSVRQKPPLLGSVVMSAWPSLMVATHSFTDPHERPVNPAESVGVMTLPTLHAPAPPAGSLETSALPASSSATHIGPATQETNRMGLPGSTAAVVHA